MSLGSMRKAKKVTPLKRNKILYRANSPRTGILFWVRLKKRNKKGI